MTPKEVLALCKSKNVQLVDVKFCDFLGTWQHFCAPIAELQEEVFEEGLGSTVRRSAAGNPSKPATCC